MAIAAHAAGTPDRGAARPPRLRPGALRRPRRGRVPRRLRALRPRRGDVAVPAHGRRDAGRPRQPERAAGPGRRARRAGGPARSTGSAARLRRHAAAGRRRRARRPPRSPPATSTAASTRTSCSRRSARRRRRSARRCGASSSTARRPRGAPRRRGAAAGRAGPAGRRPLERIVAIGQGTAAVAAQSLAASSARSWPTPTCRVEALPATELSGFAMRPDMADTLVVAISQSGTTTDTNRTVDLVRARGAAVIAIVNRRNSDLTDKADGVLYTSDGRDVEMSVAVDQGVLRPDRGRVPARRRHRRRRRRGRRRAGRAHATCWPRCGACPTPWPQVLERRAEIGRVAAELAPSRALLGDRRQRAQPHRRPGAADQAVGALLQVDRLRRHRGQEAHRPVGRAADPRVRRRADRLDRRRRRQGGGDLPGPQGGADRDRHRGRGPLRRGPPPHRRPADPPAAGLRAVGDGRAPLRLRGGAGHRRPGRARCARPGRRSRSSCRPGRAAPARSCSRALRPALAAPAGRFFDGLRAGDYDGHLEASTATRLASLLRYALGTAPLDAYQTEHGKVGTPAVVVDDLTAALTRAIEELTRPDRRHQAPGQDRHRRHQPHRRDPAAGAARAGGARRRRAARLAQLPHAARRWPTSTRRSPRSSASSATGSRATPTVEGDATAVVVDRGGVALGYRQPQRARPGAAGHQAHRRPRARGARRPGPARRAHDRDRPRGEGRRHRRPHAAAPALPRPAAGRRRPAACCRATAAASPRCATPSPRPSRPSREGSPSRPAPSVRSPSGRES